MPRSSPIQNAFNAGQWSPSVYGRTDLDKYPSALALCENWIPLRQGPLLKRPGTKYVTDVKISSKKTRLVSFEFNDEQAYVLEFGDQYIRFYRDHAQIVSGTAVEVSSPYLEAELFELQFAQSADLLYITHENHAPRQLARTSHTSWTLSEITFRNGPLLPDLDGLTTTTMSISGTTLTASAVADINGGSGFVATDVGRFVAVWNGLSYQLSTIASITSTTQVELNDSLTASATTRWRLGLYSDTDGYPRAVTFFEDRLGFGGAPAAPQRFDLSETGDYTDFADADFLQASATDASSANYTLNSGRVNIIQWMTDSERGMAIETIGGEWIVRPSTQGEALTPSNVTAKRPTTYGGKLRQPVRVGNAVLFLDRPGRKLREISYTFESDAFQAADMTVLADAITTGGMDHLAHQQDPNNIVWAPRADGTLLGFTYDVEQAVAGWHQHVMGGVSDANGTQAVVESVTSIPEPNGAYDELWLVVKRYVNGATVRHIEYMAKHWEDGDAQADAYFVDAGITYDGVATTTITGLSHLEGETVSVLADGAVHPDRTVSSGQITLTSPAAKVHVGLAYNANMKTLRFEAGAADGTAQGKFQRISSLVVRLWQTLGLKIGPDEDTLDEIIFREPDDTPGSPPPLFTGDKAVEAWDSGYDRSTHIYIRSYQPVPASIQALMPRLTTQDGG